MNVAIRYTVICLTAALLGAASFHFGIGTTAFAAFVSTALVVMIRLAIERI